MVEKTLAYAKKSDSKSSAALNRRKKHQPISHSPYDKIMHLHRTIGNHAAGQLLQSDSDGIRSTGALVGNCSPCKKGSPGNSRQNRGAFSTLWPGFDFERYVTATNSGDRDNGTGSDPAVYHTQTTGGTGGAGAAAGPVTPAASHHCAPTIVRHNIPSGTIPATHSAGKFGAPFRMEADFTANVPCTGLCGEYRQYARGYAQINGTDITHALCGNTMSRTTWYEDCASVGGVQYKYGYHSIPFSTSRFIDPDQATGFSYRGFDYPGFPTSGMPSGTVLNMQQEFWGDLVDACDFDRVLRSFSWSVRGTYTVP